jgi:hypothetical protein
MDVVGKKVNGMDRANELLDTIEMLSLKRYKD